MLAFPLIPSTVARTMRASLLCWRSGFAFFFFPAVVFAQPPQFQPGTYVYASAGPLKLEAYAIPCVADLNGDGRKDLIVGYRNADKLAIFYNTGSDAAPAFNTWSNLQAGGVDIVHPSIGCGAPAPFVCDFDADGKRDLLVGTGWEGYVYFYRNTNTDQAPILAPGVQLMVGGSPLLVAARATPYFCDWDGDGLNDLLCGDGNGGVNFFKNIGTARAPALAPSVSVEAGGVPLNLGIRSVVRIYDWDRDGAKDLLGSSNSGVYWCRNVGTDSAPVLLPPVALRAPVSGSGLVPINTGPRMRLELVDWNDDGTLDLLVGNWDGTISFFEAYDFAFTSVSGHPPGTCALQWKTAPYLTYNILTGVSPSLITNTVAGSLPSRGRTTAWTNPAVISPCFYQVLIAE